MSQVLFLIKKRQDYAHLHSNKHPSLQTGLYNSASYMNDMLNDSGISSEMVVVNDNNDIDREVTLNRPKYVIVEALWVVPSKFIVLSKLHPDIKWIVRLHSEIPFLSNEGMAMDWIGDYASIKNVTVAANAPRTVEEIRLFLRSKLNVSKQEIRKKIIYLPNFYPQSYLKKNFNKDKSHIDVACFGAIRPLKNHLLQAVAALKFAEKIGKKLRFHVNCDRVEMKGESILKNLQSLFVHLNHEGHILVGHEWSQRDEFLKICRSVDIGMQMSFSETFNIVAADIISQGVPLVGSDQIPWMFKMFSCKAVSSDDMCDVLMRSYRHPKMNVSLNQCKLTSYTNKTRKIWIKYFKN